MWGRLARGSSAMGPILHQRGEPPQVAPPHEAEHRSGDEAGDRGPALAREPDGAGRCLWSGGGRARAIPATWPALPPSRVHTAPRGASIVARTQMRVIDVGPFRTVRAPQPPARRRSPGAGGPTRGVPRAGRWRGAAPRVGRGGGG